ncbi:restriction endonuclease subunit S [Streptomyces sp. NPDC088706]|uniref:restriction endonuclease subunit S n=1 Tax=Streptomyces sp. NPDC088706 TaxID=3365870 RepID=UPI000AB20C9D
MSDSSLGIPNLQNWPEMALADICKVLRRGTAPSYVSASSVRAIGQRCVQDSGFHADKARPHDSKLLEGSLIAEAGDVLVNSTGSGTIGRSCVFRADGHFIVDSHITIARPREGIDPEWINLMIRSPWGQRRLESHCFAGSTNQIELSRHQLALTKIPVPSWGVQRRIIALLDSLSDAERGIAASIAKLRSVRQGIISEQFSRAYAEGGSPTSRMRTLDSLADVGGGLTLGGVSSGGTLLEVPYLRVANVQDGFVSTLEMKSVRVTPGDMERFRLRRDDVLVTEGGDFDKVGRGAVWDGRIDPCLNQNHVFRVRCDKKFLDPHFLNLYMSSAAGRRYFLRVVKQTTNLASINSSQLKAMPIPCPPLEGQRRTVELVGSCDERIAQEEGELAKLRELKVGLVDDLLSGRVAVAVAGG